ncbi:hypothetical protein MMC22_011503 [Lobaria immixta]|nr:hypothetical protein [Lobaria immixta]
MLPSSPRLPSFHEQAYARARLSLTMEKLANIRAARRMRALRRAELEREWARLHGKDAEERLREERLQQSLERQMERQEDAREDLLGHRRQYMDWLVRGESHLGEWEEQHERWEATQRRLRANVDGPRAPVGLQRDVRANSEEEDDATTRMEEE